MMNNFVGRLIDDHGRYARTGKRTPWKTIAISVLAEDKQRIKDYCWHNDLQVARWLREMELQEFMRTPDPPDPCEIGEPPAQECPTPRYS